MVKRIIIWVLVIGFAYFFFSTIAKSCKENAANAVEQTGTAIGDAAEAGADKVKEIASFEDDDLEPDDEDLEEDLEDEDSDNYDIDDEDDRANSDEDDDLEEDLEDEDMDEENEDLENEDSYDRSETRDSETANSNSSSASSSSSTENRYLVVAGSYREETNAEIMVDRLKDLGYDDARVFSFDFAEYYSVTAGRFSTSSEASKVATRLKAEGIDCYPHKMRSKYFD